MGENTFSAGTTIASADVNENFSRRAVAVNRQNNTTDTDVTNQRICSGWGFIQGNNTTNITEAVTLPITYDSAPIVIVSLAGSAGSTPTLITDLTGSGNTGGNATTTATGYAVTTSGFSVSIGRSVSTLASTAYYGYSWIAIGTKS